MQLSKSHFYSASCWPVNPDNAPFADLAQVFEPHWWFSVQLYITSLVTQFLVFKHEGGQSQEMKSVWVSSLSSLSFGSGSANPAKGQVICTTVVEALPYEWINHLELYFVKCTVAINGMRIFFSPELGSLYWNV